MRRRWIVLSPSVLVLLLATGPRASVPETGDLYVVQAVPGATYSVSITGEVPDEAREGAVLGPFRLHAGSHRVVLEGDGGRLATTVSIRPGSTTDLVAHLPAAPGGEPVLNTYRLPTGPIAPGKARVMVAHTATVAPADVRVDGSVVFTNIANGEYAQADVPAGPHSAAVLPTGSDTDPILGPLDVTLQRQTLTVVFAVGSPTRSSMDVISQHLPLGDDGSVAPRRIETGSAGLASRVRVEPFARR